MVAWRIGAKLSFHPETACFCDGFASGGDYWVYLWPTDGLERAWVDGRRDVGGESQARREIAGGRGEAIYEGGRRQVGLSRVKRTRL